MRVGLIGVAGVLLLGAQAAQAEASLTLTGVTDYDFRGISQTDGDPALQISFDYAGETFYAGAWGSNVDFYGEQTYSDGSTADVFIDGNVELDLIAGFAGETEGGWRWDVGATYYLYPGSEDDLGDPNDDADDVLQSENYLEIYAGGGLGPVDVKYWYSPDLYQSDETASYLEANASFDLPWELSLNLHVGYSFGDYFDELSDLAELDGSSDDADYIDYGIGIGRSFGRFDFEVRYVGTDTDTYFEVEDGILRNDDRVILSVSTTLPWTDE